MWNHLQKPLSPKIGMIDICSSNGCMPYLWAIVYEGSHTNPKRIECKISDCKIVYVYGCIVKSVDSYQSILKRCATIAYGSSSDSETFHRNRCTITHFDDIWISRYTRLQRSRCLDYCRYRTRPN